MVRNVAVTCLMGILLLAPRIEASTAVSIAGDKDNFGTGTPLDQAVRLADFQVDSPPSSFDLPRNGWCGVRLFDWAHVVQLPQGANITAATLSIVSWDMEDNGAGDGMGGAPFDSRLYLDGVELPAAFDDVYSWDVDRWQYAPSTKSVFQLGPGFLAALADGRLDVRVDSAGGVHGDCIALDYAELRIEYSAGCQSNAECDDGDACTVDTCNADGTCSSALLSCQGGYACNPDLNAAPPAGDEQRASSSETCSVNPGTPTLEVNGELDMTLECGVDGWVDPGASATDACGPVRVQTYNSGHDPYGPGPNTCAEGTYSVQYIATNSLGHTVSAIRSVHVDDRTPPTLRLKGPAHMTHPCGSQWMDPGVESLDACYGDISPEVRWTGDVNGWVEGVYTRSYTVMDSGGNSAPPVSRTVEVVDCPW